jgi:hypothetical protein
VSTVRVTDAAILKSPMTLVSGRPQVAAGVTGEGSVFLINHNTDNTLATLRFRLADVKMSAAEVPFEAGGRKYSAGSFMITSEGNPADVRARLAKHAGELGVQAYAVSQAPEVRTHPVAVPRIALVHTWTNTQDEGWFRIALDKLAIPYTYIADQKLREIVDLRSRFDVILLGPVRASPQRIVNGISAYSGHAIPWKKSDVTPNLGLSPDQTEDMRGGLGFDGLAKLQRFVEDGGLFITISNNAALPIDYGLIEGVNIAAPRDLQVRGSVLTARITDKASPITYGYGDKLAVYFNQSPVFNIVRPGGGPPGAQETPGGSRPSGRGSASDPDIPQGRPYVAPEPRPEVRPGEEPPLDAYDRERLRGYLPPPELRPRVVVRFADEKELLVSGMLAGGRELANRPVVIDVPRGKGHVLLFANNPMWRDETQGSYFLLFNAMLHWEHLGVRAAREATRGVQSGGE